MSQGDTPDPPARELVLVGGRNHESGGYRVLRQRADTVEVGELRAMREGQPITGDVVRLHPTEQHARIFECETLHSASEAADPEALREAQPAAEASANARAHPGPARIATNAYRRNWDQIFGALAEGIDEELGTAELGSGSNDGTSAPPSPGTLN
jgi:hypothetical protein